MTRIAPRFTTAEKTARIAASCEGGKWANENGVVREIERLIPVGKLFLAQWKDGGAVWLHNLYQHRTNSPVIAEGVKLDFDFSIMESGEFTIEGEEIDDRSDLARELDGIDETISAGQAARARRLDLHATAFRQVEADTNHLANLQKEEAEVRAYAKEMVTLIDRREANEYLAEKVEERVEAEDNLLISQRELEMIEVRMKVVALRSIG